MPSDRVSVGSWSAMPPRRVQFVRMRVTNLLHNTGLALGECDMATRLVGDKLDLDLSSLTSGLVIIIVVVVGGGWTLSLDTATVAN